MHKEAESKVLLKRSSKSLRSFDIKVFLDIELLCSITMFLIPNLLHDLDEGNNMDLHIMLQYAKVHI